MGVGNKTGPIDYIEHSVPLLREEFGKQDSNLLEGATWVGRGIMRPRVAMINFPEPLGPIRVRISPISTEKETPRTSHAGSK